MARPAGAETSVIAKRLGPLPEARVRYGPIPKRLGRQASKNTLSRLAGSVAETAELFQPEAEPPAPPAKKGGAATVPTAKGGAAKKDGVKLAGDQNSPFGKLLKWVKVLGKGEKPYHVKGGPSFDEDRPAFAATRPGRHSMPWPAFRLHPESLRTGSVQGC